MKEEQMKQRGLLRMFASYYRPHWKLFLLDMICATAICGIDLAFPYISRLDVYKRQPVSCLLSRPGAWRDWA